MLLDFNLPVKAAKSTNDIKFNISKINDSSLDLLGNRRLGGYSRNEFD